MASRTDFTDDERVVGLRGRRCIGIGARARGVATEMGLDVRARLAGVVGLRSELSA